MNENKKIEITSAALHIMAMVFMLCDHLWATVVPGNMWMTYVGRMTFPIFAVNCPRWKRKEKSLSMPLLITSVSAEDGPSLKRTGSPLRNLKEHLRQTVSKNLIPSASAPCSASTFSTPTGSSGRRVPISSASAPLRWWILRQGTSQLFWRMPQLPTPPASGTPLPCWVRPPTPPRR